MSTTATRLYTPERLAAMEDGDLDRVMGFALADRAETSTTVYDGMTRGETVRTAQRTIDDVAAAQGRRAAAEFAGVSATRPVTRDLMTDPVYDA